jgi:4-amino-4-deoxy-L-arabinose transferase-like glycosyltransferase
VLKKLVKHQWLISSIIIIIYLITHLTKLTALPVFADESIYIRWSQLIMDDFSRYLFFPLNDGKTPLLMWLLVPFQYIFKDQLFAARFVSVIIGLVQVLVIGAITKALGGKKKAVQVSMILTTVLPFWFFYHRMALTDGLLTLFLSICFLFLIKLILDKNHSLKYSLLAGLFLGLAFWSKLPAILFLVVFPAPLLLINKKNWLNKYLLTKISLAALLGLTIFATLKLQPAFGQLFNRGSDFLYPVSDIFKSKVWQNDWRNTKNFLYNISFYLTWPIITLNFVALFLKKHRKTQVVLLLSAILFLTPMSLLGKVVYPRYLMPAIIFLTVSASLTIESIILEINKKKLNKKIAFSFIFIFFLAQTLAFSNNFIYQSLFNPDQAPLPPEEQEQYLLEWSSGHGIKETTELIIEQSKSENILVLTEGFFGTLPDGILMYLHNKNVENIFVEGIGQPLVEIPALAYEKGPDFDKIWLVVNSHRVKIDMSNTELVKQFCRPQKAPCLQIFDITSLVDSQTL